MQTIIRPGSFGQITTTKQDDHWVARARFRTLGGEYKDVRRKRTTRRAAHEALLEALEAPELRLGGGNGVGYGTALSEAMFKWESEALPALDLGEGTLRVYKSALGTLCQQPEAFLALGEIDSVHLSEVLHRIGVANGPGQAKLARTVLRRVFSWAVSKRAIKASPAATASFSVRAIERERGSSASTHPSRENKRRALTRAEEDRLVRLVTNDEYAIRLRVPELLHALRATGARLGEACALQWDGVDTRARTLHIPGTKTGNAARNVRIPSWYAEYLDAYRPDTDHMCMVCPSATGKRRDPANTGKLVRKVFDGAGFDWVTSHTFRRTVATRLDDAGWPARAIANHLGHAKVSMTTDYYLERHERLLDTDGAL